MGEEGKGVPDECEPGHFGGASGPKARQGNRAGGGGNLRPKTKRAGEACSRSNPAAADDSEPQAAWARGEEGQPLLLLVLAVGLGLLERLAGVVHPLPRLGQVRLGLLQHAARLLDLVALVLGG
jgi:hypothetical protein